MDSFSTEVSLVGMISLIGSVDVHPSILRRSTVVKDDTQALEIRSCYRSLFHAVELKATRRRGSTMVFMLHFNKRQTDRMCQVRV